MDSLSSFPSTTMSKPLFAHRPPTMGVHLLNDPVPEDLLRIFSARAEHQPFTVSKRMRSDAKPRKTKRRS